MAKICLTPNVSGIGGMVSFRQKLTDGLNARGVQVSSDISDRTLDAVLVIGGTRQLAGLWKLKRRGVRLVQRLDGINWIHRQRRTGLKHYLRAEMGNFLQNLIRTRLADQIVYQSQFAKSWWQDWHGEAKASSTVIFNGVDLKTYHPEGLHERPHGVYRLLVVEGSLAGGYETGLANAVSLAETLVKQFSFPIELMVVGQVSDKVQRHWSSNSRIPILWAGTHERETIPYIDRSAHIFYAADLHPACPNAVIEALACGLPVAAFATGAITELVPDSAGAVVPYGTNPWKLEIPDIASLAEKVALVLKNLDSFRHSARRRAEQLFSLDSMVSNYLHILLEAA